MDAVWAANPSSQFICNLRHRLQSDLGLELLKRRLLIEDTVILNKFCNNTFPQSVTSLFNHENSIMNGANKFDGLKQSLASMGRNSDAQRNSLVPP